MGKQQVPGVDGVIYPLPYPALVTKVAGPRNYDTDFLRHCIDLSLRARTLGKHPFAAAVVDGSGRLVAEAMNDVPPPGGDPTRHAELLAVADAARQLPPAQLRLCTLYTSAEPCAMCAGAIYWCQVGRVVYALSEASLLRITGNHPENPTLSLPCRTVFASGQRAVEVLGPFLEEAAALPHAGFWNAP